MKNTFKKLLSEIKGVYFIEWVGMFVIFVCISVWVWSIIALVLAGLNKSHVWYFFA